MSSGTLIVICIICISSSTASAGAAAANSSRGCRCLAGESCFPSERVWSDFDHQIGGRLLRVRPPASACYDANATSRHQQHGAIRFEQASCAEVSSNWANSLWRSSQVGAAENPNWETSGSERCPIPSSSGDKCSQGSVPVYAVNVSGASEVQEAIAFARRYNLRLVVKNTGHDYLGRSSARGSLSIWMHNLKQIRFHDSFYEHGCSREAREQNENRSAVTVGAGVQWAELYAAADAAGKVVVGALSASVGAAGGYAQGGGHSPLAPTYGLAADNVLEFQVVTPDGEVRLANGCVNRDLFWALRGGGGGTFGVVVSATHRTYPAPNHVLSTVYVATAGDASSYSDLLTEFARIQPALTDAGWAGYFTLWPLNLVIRYLALDRDPAFAAQSFEGFLYFVRNHPRLSLIAAQTTSYGTFHAWYNTSMCAFYPANCIDRVGINRALISRLIPRSNFEYNPSQLANALISVLSSNATTNMLLGIHVGGGSVAIPRENAVNPAWRNAIWLLTAESNWDDSASQELIQSRATLLTEANRALRNITPGSGTYFNEADYNEPDWQQSFFGDNYPQLLAIKQSIDPDGLLVCRHCVGSEDWTEDLNCPA